MKTSLLSGSPAAVFDWHARPGAFERLTPPWERAEVVASDGELREGSRVELRVGPLGQAWVAEHRDVRPGQSFQDVQVTGPFARWEHAHEFVAAEHGQTRLHDRIEFELPLSPVSDWIAGPWIRRKLERMFEYRHRVTQGDILLHNRVSTERGRATMKIGVTGSSGLVGSALIPVLTTGGHEAVRIVRSSGQPSTVAWDPAAGRIDASALEGVDAVVHLAGESIASGRWSEERKAAIRNSRVEGTRLIAETMAGMKRRPKVLVCASAIGFYGDRGDELLEETSVRGDDFLATVCEEWEQAASAAREAGIRVVHLRLGIVLSGRGGALAKMLPPFKLGAGGPLGHGRQWMSWIAIDDVVGAIVHALTDDSMEGPVNAVAPNPLTNADFTKVLGAVLRRPAFLPAPAFALRLLLGEMADALLLSSARVVPKSLEQAGYQFRFPQLEGALRHVLGRPA